MPNPNATPFLKSQEEITDIIISALPAGYLYKNNDGLRQIINGYAKTYFEIAKDIQKIFDDLFTININNQFLDKFLGEYGLPNVIFPSIQNASQAVSAISAMRVARKLASKEDFENFMALLGFTIKFYHNQNTLLDHYIYPYTYPRIYGGIKPKNKITWLVEIVDNSQSKANYGMSHPRYYYNSTSDTVFAKKILDYLKPSYIIFKYIDSSFKELYNIS